MFEVYILTPCVSMLCVATLSEVLTSLNLGPVRDYGLHIVTTRPKSKRCRRLHPEQMLVVSPCPASSTRCHPKHGLAIFPCRPVMISSCGSTTSFTRASTVTFGSYVGGIGTVLWPV